MQVHVKPQGLNGPEDQRQQKTLNPRRGVAFSPRGGQICERGREDEISGDSAYHFLSGNPFLLPLGLCSISGGGEGSGLHYFYFGWKKNCLEGILGAKRKQSLDPLLFRHMV